MTDQKKGYKKIVAMQSLFWADPEKVGKMGKRFGTFAFFKW
jgi:hypothetical protein